MNYNILIGGAAGQGINTLSSLLEKILHRKGYYLFSNMDYMSRVRGGHNFVQIRFGDEPITSHHSALDLVIALDQETLDLHQSRLKDTGVIFIDRSLNESKTSDNKQLKTYDFKSVAKELENNRVEGSVTVGAVLKHFGLDLDYVKESCDSIFKKVSIAQLNYTAIEKGMDLAESLLTLNPMPNNQDKILINGNQALALGALAGGLDYYVAYPMSPSTGIMTYLSSKQSEAGIVVEQAEDEIAAINMAIGGAYAGARSMTGTSGGGFSLMVESLGLSGIMEIPLVVVDVQRPGPATGLPTRTEQSDLSFVLTASHGEISRMILSVKSAEDAFYATVRALNIADKYQIPVIILSDQFLADTSQTIDAFNFDNITINRHISKKEDITEGTYKRYEMTENGISPRIIPGKIEGQVILSDSDEHDEYGNITESADVRIKQMNKRMQRLEMLKSVVEEPEHFGSEQPNLLLMGWGSMYGPLQEAVKMLQDDGYKVASLVFGDLYPLPTKLLEKYHDKANTLVNVEQNFTGQLGKLIRQETGIHCQKSILKYDGRQLSGEEIYNRVIKEVL
ncbi:2-oxoglutarate ferredoxin oxidoreductase subunit alpha [Natranaerovirga hydrolytica]|uniref:2-oxoglutarate ferredoxin oxidoreductase subunit alpha n=1 Tax=Natranaerovirga hydrolytica TaxID=680378 RepID=A0A4R1N4B9_9FIRM|nr:2-oxoacid:acceptor oxidoreductase subunit alpha [Natranaerovirga hydrolytica]TCK97779.1 2-oxoglutarate ferredoxin oxidoreductase subunit alpha [Natranaerovirga hydrolytica]